MKKKFSYFSNTSEAQDIFFPLMVISARVVALFSLASSWKSRHFAITVGITHQKLSSLRRIFIHLIQSQFMIIYYCFINYITDTSRFYFLFFFSFIITASPTTALVTFPKILKEYLTILHQKLMHHFLQFLS